MPSDPSAGHSSPFASRSRERRRCLRSAVILGIALLLPSGTVAASSAFASTTARNAGSGTTLKKCSSSAVSAAVAKGGVINVKCSGTIKLTHTLTITKKQNVTLNATHEKFTLTFPPSASAKFGTMHHVFLVSGGKLSLISVGIEDTQSNTATTQDGKDGRGGAGGTTPSSPGANGSNGKSGANGQSATNAKSVTGGCMVIQKGSVVSITNSNISGCVAEAGWGGWGGQGGSAGAGGTGATGRDGTESDPNGGRGGNGGNAGARGGNGGKAGNGGSAFGGAIYNRGKLTLSGATFTKDSAIAGGGGNGGAGGWGGTGGSGGCCYSDQKDGINGAGGNAGNGLNGTNGGNASNGGNALGGAVCSNHNLKLGKKVAFSNNKVVAGPPGNSPGSAGEAGAGGTGGTGSTNGASGSPGHPGKPGKPGVKGKAAGPGLDIV